MEDPKGQGMPKRAGHWVLCLFSEMTLAATYV